MQSAEQPCDFITPYSNSQNIISPYVNLPTGAFNRSYMFWENLNVELAGSQASEISPNLAAIGCGYGGALGGKGIE